MITATTRTSRRTRAGHTARTARRLARHGILLAAVGLLTRFIGAGWDDIAVSFHSLTTSNAELLIVALGWKRRGCGASPGHIGLPSWQWADP